MILCPHGHQTTSTDYCDVCGAPMEAGAPEVVALAAAPVEQPVVDADRHSGQTTKPCPSCSAVDPVDALFCEGCGYDFTTGAMPRSAGGILDLDVPVEASAAPAEAVPASDAPQPEAGVADVLASIPPEQQALCTDDPATEAEALAVASEADEPVVEAPGPSSPAPNAVPDDPAAGVPAPLDATPGDETPQAPTPVPDEIPNAEAVAPGLEAPAAVSDQVEWVAEVWVDPEWYAAQHAEDRMPSPGLPDIVPLRKKTNLIGRESRSRGIEPDVDCHSDNSCSRRQAQLTTDGTRWFVEDLDSANGTYVGSAGAPLPEHPIPRGRTELGSDDRIFVGAWTRIVVRKATPDERAALA